MDQAMEDAFQQVSASGLSTGLDLGKKWRAANKFWKEGAEVFNTSLMTRLAKDDPASVVRAIGSSPGNMRATRDVIEGFKGTIKTSDGIAVSGQEIWTQVQGELLSREASKAVTIGRSAGIKNGLIDGTSMLNQIQKNNQIFEEAFSKEGVANITKVFKRVALAQGEGAAIGLPGGMWIQLTQATAAAAVGGGILAIGFAGEGEGGLSRQALAGAGLVLLGPAVTSRLFANPNFSKWLIQGTDKTITAQKRIRALIQLTAMATREGMVVANTSEQNQILHSNEAPEPFTPWPAFLEGPQQ
jgi:hypothetical protein